MSFDRIKIKVLARELGVTSREVIERCRAAGLPAQNSITKLTQKQAALVRSWFADNASSAERKGENPDEDEVDSDEVDSDA